MDLLRGDLAVPAPQRLHVIPVIADERGQLLDPLRIRYIMDTVDEGQLLPVKMLRHCLIRCKHEILDQHSSHVPLVRFYIQRMSFLIQQDLALREIEINGSPLLSLLPQFVREFSHLLEHREQFPVLGIVCYGSCAFPGGSIRRTGVILYTLRLLQQLFHHGIRHPFLDPDHRFADLIVHDLAFFIHLHQAA